MKIYVNKDWLNNWDWTKADSKPQFIGRESERARLSHFVTDRQSGAMFVGGDRGSGKSSLIKSVVYGDLYEKVDYYEAKVIFPLTGGKLNPKKTTYAFGLIEQLVRAINLKNEGDSAIETLLAEMNATKLLRKNSLAILKETRFDFSNSLDIPSLFGAAKDLVQPTILFLITLALKKFPYLQQFSTPWSNEVLTALNLLAATFFGGTLFKTYYRHKRTSLGEYAIEKNKISILELEKRVKDILHNLKKKNSKPQIVCFEELDQYDDGPENTKIVLNALKTIKLLLHGTDVVFIFVLGTNSYKELNEYGPSEESTFTTLPTDKFFVSVSSPSDMISLLKKIFRYNGDSDDTSQFALFCWLLVKESGGNYHKLTQVIRDRLLFDEKERPYIKLGEISSLELRKAAMTLAAADFYDHFTNKVKDKQENNSLLRSLLMVVDHVFNQTKGGTKELLLPHDPNAQEAPRAFVKYLYELAKKPAPVDQQNAQGGKFIIVDIADLQLTPNELAKGIKGPISDEEKSFVKTFEAYKERLRQFLVDKTDTDISDITSILTTLELNYSLVGKNYTEVLKPALIAYKEITSKNFPDRREDILLFIANDALPALKNADEALNKIVLNPENPLIIQYIGEALVQRDGEVAVTLRQRDHERGNAFSSLVRIQYKSLELPVFETQIDGEGILNVILGTKPFNRDVWEDNEFYMVRLDARTGDKDSILLKKEGERSWTELLKGKSNTVSGKWNKFRLHLDDKRIRLQKIISGRYQTTCESKIDKEILWWGLGSELVEVVVKMK